MGNRESWESALVSSTPGAVHVSFSANHPRQRRLVSGRRLIKTQPAAHIRELRPVFLAPPGLELKAALVLCLPVPPGSHWTWRGLQGWQKLPWTQVRKALGQQGGDTKCAEWPQGQGCGFHLTGHH